MFRSLALSFSYACLALAVTIFAAPVSAQTAVRVGPQSAVGTARPKVVEVQANEPVAKDTATETAASAPTNVTALSQAAKFAAAKLEVAERQLARLGPYNLYAQPGEMIYTESDVLPPAQQIRPVRVGAGVQLFQPDSSFSHVIQKALDNRRQSALELEAERLNPPVKREPRSAEAIGAELRLLDAQQANVQRRMQQLSNMSSATYSSLYRNLGDKLELQAYRLQLQREAAEAELAGQ